MNQPKTTIREYLDTKNITYTERNNELIASCIFNDCDKDSRTNEAHLYFSIETGQYHCKKCDEKGNQITLMKHFGDTIKKPTRNKSFSTELVHQCHSQLPERLRTYLNDRGINDDIINSYKLGYGVFYGKNYITIPVSDEEGYQFFKLRQDPQDGNEKITYPSGKQAQLYGMYAPDEEDLIICEGELDALALISQGFFALSSTHGANTFKEEWVDKDIQSAGKVFVCFDNDEAGEKGSSRVLMILDTNKVKEIYDVKLPDVVGEAGDITDYLTKLKLPAIDLFTKYAKRYPERIDGSQFQPLSPDELADVLDLTIKKDRENKIVTFLCLLSAYTENAQFNLSFNSPSSTGKSYIALEIAKLFPKVDVVKLGRCSRTAFFHEQGKYDKENNQIIIDFSRKILIFTDMPHTGLLEELRSFLSHDDKITLSKITDKGSKGGNRTKTVALIGYPSVVFCSAGLRMDEQEMTRFILLSPEINQDKIRAGISNTVQREIDNDGYTQWLDTNPARQSLKLRIQAIKQEKIDEVNIENKESILKHFLGEDGAKKVQPRHQRDIKRLLSIIKSFALLNLWWREREGTSITANEEDIQNAIALWERISQSQEYNLPPYIYSIYSKVIVPIWEEKQARVGNPGASGGHFGIGRQELLQKHYDVYNRMLDGNQLRMQILPMLETAGLIIQESTGNDKRKRLIFPAGYKKNMSEKVGLTGQKPNNFGNNTHE
jgi:5S rRNA maturation endonuclease (ribonuclease M5)